jgi:hypothetical protein
VETFSAFLYFSWRARHFSGARPVSGKAVATAGMLKTMYAADNADEREISRLSSIGVNRCGSAARRFRHFGS